jgi:hypothetical protein
VSRRPRGSDAGVLLALLLGSLACGKSREPAAPAPAPVVPVVVPDADPPAVVDAGPVGPVGVPTLIAPDPNLGPGMCAPFVGSTERRSFTPKLFARGQDPSLDPDCTELVNPERGFFVSRDLRSLRESDLPRSTHTLVYGKGALADYLDRDLDPDVLTQIKAGFSIVRRAGFKVLPRFYYAKEAGDPQTTTLRAVAHIAQLTPIWRDNVDVIAALHAGFLGDWGEWHTNAIFVPEADRLPILGGVLAGLPASRMVLVRRPAYKRENFGGPVTEADMFSGTSVARVGIHNDCFLASATDKSTYLDEADRAYAHDDSNFTAVGGETCGVNPPRSECATALAEMEHFHWSFINADYDRAVLDRWRTEGCEPRIACRLGYRFVLRGHEAPTQTRRGDTLSVSIDVTNDGFARAFNARPVMVVLTGQGKKVALPTGIDARSWAPGADVSLCLAVRVPAELPAGNYRIGLSLPDPDPGLGLDPRYAIRLAGGVTWQSRGGVNDLDAQVTITE